MALDEKARSEEVRRRLEQLAERWPQAEIARRLGTSRTNISRYLRGTRVPLYVGGALVEKLGVNPAWLLTGEGAPMLSDVSDATEKTAGDLLALVEAMSRVARMRLGSLTGKHHLRVLRELNDALGRHEELRERLNRQTVPQFRELLEHYERALLNAELDTADGLRRALTQLARLCDSDELQRDFTRAQAYHELYFGDPARAVELQRRVYHSFLPAATLTDAKAVSEAYNFSLTLSGQNRVREARAVCRTALVMAEDTLPGDSSLNVLRCAIANHDARLGRVREALRDFAAAWAQLDEEDRPGLSGSFVAVMYLAGTVDYFGALGLAPGDGKASAMLWIAAFVEDKAALEHACANFIGAGEKVAARRALARLVTRLLELRKGRTGSWKQEADGFLKAAAAQRDHVEGLRLAVYAAQLARVAGDKPAARRASAKATAHLGAMPADVTPHPLVLGTHQRNLLQIGKPAERKAAAAFLQGHLRRGYGCFRGMAPAES